MINSQPSAYEPDTECKNATVTIVDNDLGPEFKLDAHWASEYFVMESEGLKRVAVLRGNDVDLAPFTVDFATRDKTAVAGRDYVATNGTLSFAEGETVKTFTVPILDDQEPEEDEQFVVALANPSNGRRLGPSASVTVRILDTTGLAGHRIERLAALPDRSVRLTLGGSAARTDRDQMGLYPIEVSSDLAHWTPWTTLLRTNASAEPLVGTEAAAAGFEQRFYRTAATNLITPFVLQPTGPFPVGVVWRLVTDPTRRNRYDVSTNNSFMVSIWYPAVAVAGRLPGPIWDARLWPYLVGHAVPDLPCATDDAPYPIVLYSHGLGNDRGSASEKGPYLASHGYVVVAMDHHDADGTVFPDGAYFQASTTPSDGPALQGRVADELFLLAELTRWNQDDPLFAGRLDVNAVAAVGFSFGGVTSGELGRTDPRCKAVVLYDPMPLYTAPELTSLGVQKPLLQINASNDAETAPYSRSSKNALWFQISQSDHGSMGGHDYYPAWFPSELPKVREAARTVAAYTLVFLNKHLKGRNDPLLDAPSASFPRVVNWKIRK